MLGFDVTLKPKSIREDSFKTGNGHLGICVLHKEQRGSGHFEFISDFSGDMLSWQENEYNTTNTCTFLTSKKRPNVLSLIDTPVV